MITLWQVAGCFLLRSQLAYAQAPASLTHLSEDAAHPPITTKLQQGPHAGTFLLELSNQKSGTVSLSLGLELGDGRRFATAVSVQLVRREPTSKAIPLGLPFAVHRTLRPYAVTIPPFGKVSVIIDLHRYVADDGRLIGELPSGEYDFATMLVAGIWRLRSNTLLLRLPTDQ